jgi:xanthine dehydrogenase accessory factor
MRDILSELDRWHAEQKPMALATVVQTWGSSPRRAGAKMVVASDGQFSGSVSGGCVENAVIEAALDVIKTGQARLLHFGVADETAWQVGLACGGSIDIFVRPLDTNFFSLLRAAWMDEQAHCIHATVIRGPWLGREVLIREDEAVIGDFPALSRLRNVTHESSSQRKSRRAMLGEENEVFLEWISPPPTLVVVGGVHITIALVSLAKITGFRTVVIDPRSAWGNEARFPDLDRLITAWPQEALRQVKITQSTAIVMLTHDPKLDDPALKAALTSRAFYVGALGSRATNAKRRERLLSDGMSEAQLSRLHAPIGLDIGAETPEEIALAILSEVVKAYRQQHQAEARKEPEATSNP